MRRHRRPVLGAVLLAAAVFSAACGKSGETGGATGGASAGGNEEKGTIVVGVSGAFAENQLVAEMYAQVLENAGYTVDRKLDLESREVSEQALVSGDIDVKPEYLSSLLLFLDPNATASGDSANVAQQDADLLAPDGITMLDYTDAQDTNVFVANSETADKYGLTTVSDLAPVAGDLTLGGPPECPERPFCIPGLKKVYGVEFGDFKALDVGGPQTVAALASDAVQVGLLFSTDPQITENGFVPLEDDMHLQNAENIAPVIRDDVLNDEITQLLNGVSSKLTTENVTGLVGQVVVDQQDVSDVAHQFLVDNGLL